MTIIYNLSEQTIAKILTGPIEQFEDSQFVGELFPEALESQADKVFEVIRIRLMINQVRVADAAKESAEAAKDAARSARFAVYVAYASFAVAAAAFYWAAKYGG